MTRVQPVTEEMATGEVKEIYAGIKKKMGKVPNIFLNMGNSAAALKAYLALADVLGQTNLSPKLRELIALTVAEANQCGYCLSAHTAIAQGSGIVEKEILQARKGESTDDKTRAILLFTKLVVDKKGHVDDGDVAALKAAGVSDGELVEIIVAINMNMFTNYFNHITDPKIDFPVVSKI